MYRDFNVYNFNKSSIMSLRRRTYKNAGVPSGKYLTKVGS